MNRGEAPVGAQPEAEAPPVPVDFRTAVRTWAKIGVLSFGGPAGQIALMHRILVEEKCWVSERRFLHALNFCMLLPGPEAQQLAVYIGWLLHRTRGGLAAGVLFVLPGALVILALSVLYAGFQDLPVVQAVFFGIKAAVLAIVIDAVRRIGQRALKTRTMLVLAGAAFVAIFFLAVPFPLIVLAAGLAGLIGGRLAPVAFGVASPQEDAADTHALGDQRSLGRSLRVLALGLLLWLGPVAALLVLLGPDQVFSQLALFFSKLAVVTFGGAYAVLAYVAQAAVGTHGWLAPGEMLDGLGLAETTPGPLILVVQFVGFLGAFRNPGPLDPMLAGGLGALLTLWVTFAPCFLWIFLGAPYIEALRGNRPLSAALAAITAAVVGVVLNLSLWFALHVVFGTVTEGRAWGLRLLVPDLGTLDLAALGLGIGALIAILRFKAGVAATLAVSAAIGVAIYFVRA